ncbi:peptide ABC transporter ATP-binding protein [Sporosarcina globispora]|uniref:Peptide ABC transporter ATP-binding protein n=1 Tax=Sporosarcina globispora TaxID=1459 RepID=A0A0M0GE07_SPOGL|nr:ABC transporter ATP-binding protein [Sporosarcina globispora]KON87983.1 peptide ABC transporter ATP-binding protein [Sporosarcina globispora]
MSDLLTVENLTVEFKNGSNSNKVVKDLSFHINQGETVGIVGESGCGKSVTSLAIMSLVPSPAGKVSSGKIIFKDENLLEKKQKALRKIRGKEIAMIFQDPMSTLDPAFKVGFQIDEVLKLHTNLSKKQIKNKTIELLKSVGIPSPEQRYNQYPYELSGGMRQRVVIAMALACNPELLIADEPTTALDVTVQAQILDLMNDLKVQFNTSIMMITHDIGVVAETCNRVIVMYAGQIVEEANIRDLFDHAAHPYTQGLLKSVPKINSSNKILHSIPGNVPTPEEMPNGCRFYPRCPIASEKCRNQEPPLEKMKENHKVRCWHIENVLKKE